MGFDLDNQTYNNRGSCRYNKSYSVCTLSNFSTPTQLLDLIARGSEHAEEYEKVGHPDHGVVVEVSEARRWSVERTGTIIQNGRSIEIDRVWVCAPGYIHTGVIAVRSAAVIVGRQRISAACIEAGAVIDGHPRIIIHRLRIVAAGFAWHILKFVPPKNDHTITIIDS